MTTTTIILAIIAVPIFISSMLMIVTTIITSISIATILLGLITIIFYYEGHPYPAGCSIRSHPYLSSLGPCSSLLYRQTAPI